MHEVESTTWKILSQLIVRLDPARAGVCIDAGAGDFDWYFEWFANYGYRTIVVEPVPSEPVRELCKARGIQLVDRAVGDDFTPKFLYIQGDLRTLNPTHWGGKQLFPEEKLVGSDMLSTIINSIANQAITCLKLDIEGAEWAALRTLPIAHFIPEIVAFEFGGLFPKQSGRGGWTKEATANTQKCLNLLKKLGYISYVLIGEGSTGLIVKPFTDQRRLFSPDLVWGNIIATRAAVDDWQALAASELRFSL